MARSASPDSSARSVLPSILGAGALGCTIGAALTEGGHPTWLLDRWPDHVETMRRDGLRVDDENGSRRVSVRAATQASEVGVVDLVVVPWKRHWPRLGPMA